MTDAKLSDGAARDLERAARKLLWLSSIFRC